jgi:hypothetical protein
MGSIYEPIPGPFDIAEFLSAEQIDLAIAQTYRSSPFGFSANVRTEDGKCPLAVACATARGYPSPDEVAEAILGYSENTFPPNTPKRRYYGRVRRAAYSFTSSWDRGRIANLATALGR